MERKSVPRSFPSSLTNEHTKSAQREEDAVLLSAVQQAAEEQVGLREASSFPRSLPSLDTLSQDPRSRNMTDNTRARLRLSSTLAGHATDVRSLATAPSLRSTSTSPSNYSPTTPYIFSSSRDGTARSWTRADDPAAAKGGQGGGWNEGSVFTEGEGFVNAVEWLPTSSDNTEAEGGTFCFLFHHREQAGRSKSLKSSKWGSSLYAWRS